MEMIDIVTEDGMPLGSTRGRSEVHTLGLWHRTAHVWVCNSAGQLLLQKRSLSKDTYPGFWDVSCAGHLSAGDTSIAGALRELHEELGIVASPDALEFLFTCSQQYHTDDDTIRDNEIVDVYLLILPYEVTEINLSPDEVAAVRAVSLLQLQTMLNSNETELVPHPQEYQGLFARLG